MTGQQQSRPTSERPWWDELGLRITRERGAVSSNEERVLDAHREVLEKFAPLRFERTDGARAGEHLTLPQVVRRVTSARRKVEREIHAAERDRRELGWSRIEAAYSSDDADVVITEGTWEGFTRAQATAWLWNLVQYEPYQFTGVLSTLRREREQALEAGEIPEVPRYAARARELENAGLTPRAYRTAREALGARTFSPGDVRSGPWYPPF